ncbi:MAG: SsrA-binding protein SmpB [Candidatus Moranbacteria bacterium]|nr:SsrA-binding protein SmpB [Candidatus Moranbacteria bacterium]
MKKLAINRRARFDYEILETFEAGLVLKGYEVKSIKTGRVSLKGAFVTIRGEELYLTNANIPLYQHAGLINDYDPASPRKLIMHKKEIKRLIGKARTEGLTLVPISVYNKRNLIKLEFALAKGKKQRDKREDIKKREDKRRVERMMKNVN